MMGHGSDDHHIHVYKLLIVVLVIFARSYDCQDFKSNNVQALSNLTSIEGAGKVQVHNNGQQGFHHTGEEGRSADVNQPVQDAVHIDFNQEKKSSNTTYNQPLAGQAVQQEINAVPKVPEDEKLREQAWLKEMHKKTQAKYLEMKRQAELAKTTVAAGQPEESVDKKLSDVERNMKQRGEETIKKSTEHLVVQGQADNNRIPVVENKERPVDRLSLSDDLGSRRTASPISDSNQNNVNNNNVQNSNSDNNNNIPQWNSNNNDNNQPQFGQVNDNRQQEFQQQPNAQRQPQQPQIGGINLSWDWEDFSIMFNNYGAAEMKVRRAPHPSTGEPWPMPQYYSKKDNKVYQISRDLRFVSTGITCDILDEALVRHLQRTLRGSVEDMYDNLQNAEGTNIEDPALRYEKDEFVNAPVITSVEIKVRKPCDKYPSLESDESYDLVVKKKKTYIWANEIWGVLRGLETFGQLVWTGPKDNILYIKETVVSDYPRFPHRGLHVDTSRHYLFKEVLLDILDSMEMNKLNVFHWHIVDDQSFPYESQVYPELSRKGAFHPTYVYSLEDISEIIEYARMRGIRVMPEFDTPGHTYSWGLSRPELLTQCYSGSSPVKGYLGPIDPSKNSTYRFLKTLFQEVMDVFKDQYLHLGGDEVPLGCWQSNAEVMAFATELAKLRQSQQQQPNAQSVNSNQQFQSWSIWSDDVKRVYEYYENRLIQILNELGKKRKKGIKYIMWQEVMNNNLQLPNDTIIQVWMGDMGDVMRATSLGYHVLYSTCWYMDHIEYGTKWPKYYNCDPVDASYGYHIDEKKVLGGEAAFWSEYFTNENLIPMMWPRASAAAERLWSSKDVRNLDKAAERLTEHRCRMLKRGINAGEINGPGYCLHAPPRRRLFNDTVGCQGGNCSRTHNIVHIEDIQLTLSQKGSLADCGSFFNKGGISAFIVLLLVLLALAALYALSKSSSKLHRLRICKNRSILLVFVVVILVYFLCYTTIWMRGFEFSGSFHKTLQEDNLSEAGHGHNKLTTS
ncbi:beta-hexosaminidase subunit alpha isoform X2 [Biomphalaria glabrata]|nr:beta-hexosaminidase subunit alpha isoform X2 [Biomphalaria glabrata]